MRRLASVVAAAPRLRCGRAACGAGRRTDERDGHPSPEIGACTSLSTAWRLEAVPALVIHGPQAQAAPYGQDDAT